MTQPAFIPGAPPPGSPPPAAPPGAATDTTKEERLLAAAAYLGYFTGFWLIVPIVIYVFKREQSRFVAHHAVRAVLLHLIALPLFLLGWVLGAVVHILLLHAFDDRGRHASGGAGALVMGLTVLAWGLPWIAYLALTAVAALRAFQGRVQTTSLLGRFVERLLGQDRTVGTGTGPAQFPPR